MSQPNSTLSTEGCAVWLLKGKLIRTWVFHHFVRLKCSVSKWSHILLSITKCRHALMIIITALWLSSLQRCSVTAFNDAKLSICSQDFKQGLSVKAKCFILSLNPNPLQTLLWKFSSQILGLESDLAGPPLSCSASPCRQLADADAVSETVSQHSSHPCHACLARKLIGWFLNFGSAHS